MAASQSEIFAWLSPLNPTACGAYDAMISTTIENPQKYRHLHKFLRINSDRTKRAGSVFSEDEKTADQSDEFLKTFQWTGAFQFSLNTLPSNPSKGWYLGTNRGRASGEEVDIMLAPPSAEWKNLGIAGKHARLFIHPESCRMVLEARHMVTIGRNGATIFSRSSTHVLEQGEMINIGDCVYVFEYAPFFTTSMFEVKLREFMQTYHEPK